MTTFVCVCQSRAAGHRTGDEPVHLLNRGGNETECGDLALDDAMPVRTLSGFTGGTPFCADCAMATSEFELP